MKSGDAELPTDEYLSKWLYFKTMFFLRDSMPGRRMSSNLKKSSALKEARSESCSPAPSIQSASKDSDIFDLDSANNKDVDTETIFKLIRPPTKKERKWNQRLAAKALLPLRRRN